MPGGPPVGRAARPPIGAVVRSAAAAVWA